MQEHALADNSIKTRKSQWKDYHEFCATYDVVPLPCTQDGVCLYVAFMTRKFKYSSIESYLSALSYLQQMYGYSPVNASNFMVKRTMLGAKRKLGYSPVQAMPLEPEHLLKFYAHLNMGDSFQLCWWVAAITAFRGLLRKAHVTVSSQSISVQDVKFHDWGLLLTLPRTKTIQYGERILQIPFTLVPGSPLCVVYFIKYLLVHTGARPDQPLFQYRRHGRFKPMTYSAFSGELRRLTKLIGLDGKVSSHSLRRGGASYLSSIGFDLIDIKSRGDWKSLAVLLYLVDGLDKKVAKDKVVTSFLRVM